MGILRLYKILQGLYTKFTWCSLKNNACIFFFVELPFDMLSLTRLQIGEFMSVGIFPQVSSPRSSLGPHTMKLSSSATFIPCFKSHLF